jgi:hypothetical protein
MEYMVMRQETMKMYDRLADALAEWYMSDQPYVNCDEYFDICDRFDVDPSDLEDAILESQEDPDTWDLY